MTSEQKVTLLQKMIFDFWNTRDEASHDELQTLVEMIDTVLEFGGEKNDG